MRVPGRQGLSVRKSRATAASRPKLDGAVDLLRIGPRSVSLRVDWRRFFMTERNPKVLRVVSRGPPDSPQIAGAGFRAEVSFRVRPYSERRGVATTFHSYRPRGTWPARR